MSFKSKELNIIDGPDDGPFDDMVNLDDVSHLATFNTKEIGEVTIYCKCVGIDGPSNGKGVNIGISNDHCSILYDSVKKTGKIKLYNSLNNFRKNCAKVA